MNARWLGFILILLLIAQIGTAKTLSFCNNLSLLNGDFYKNAPTEEASTSLPVTSVLIRKDIRRLYLLHFNTIIKSFPVALGIRPSGHKQRKGDLRTPEGLYFINHKKDDSSYHLSLQISYPNAKDILEAKLKGVDPGGDIFIHGLPNEPGLKKELLGGIHPLINWTLGCVAVTDPEIEEIFSRVQLGTPIEICPVNDASK